MPKYTIDITFPIRVSFQRTVETSLSPTELRRQVEDAMRRENMDLELPDADKGIELPSVDAAVRKASVDGIDLNEVEVEVYE